MIEDAKTVNENWARECYLNFEGALDKQDDAQALACIGDMREFYPEEAARMDEEFLLNLYNRHYVKSI